MLKKTSIGFVIIVMIAWAGGCSDKPVEPAADSNTPNLTDEFGGYTAAPEMPGFGDSELIESDNDESEVDDPLLASPAIASLVSDPRVVLFHVRAVWGQLRYDSTVTDVTDWTGSMTLSRGAIVVRRLIRFEPQQDQLLARTERGLVEWQSYTTVHHDGIAVDLYVQPMPPTFDTTIVVDPSGDTAIVVDTIPPEPVTLAFETGPYSRTFTLRELAALDTVVTLDDGNAVAFHAFHIFRHVCPRGILVGHWGYDDEGNGVFRGSWRSLFGRIVGHLKGHFGRNDQGEGLFFGKWIDTSGRFEGFLKGRWGGYPDINADIAAREHAGGWFAGGIFDADRQRIGALEGRYCSSERWRGGWFQGRWKVFCANRPAFEVDGGPFDDGF
jgi:hypothetical protein